MEWLSIDEVAQFAATNDVIEFRQRNFGFIRKKVGQIITQKA
jgi:hypothetical protein